LGAKPELDKNPERIVIDDFNLGQLNVQAIGAPRTMPKVVKMQPANGRITRARRISVPAVLAVGIASLLVVWAYHPFAQGLVSSLFGQTPQPAQAVVPLAEAAVTASNETITRPGESIPNESTPGVVSSEPVMVRAPETFAVQANAVNDQLNSSESNSSVPDSSVPNSSEPDSSKPNVKVQGPKPIASTSASNKALVSQSVPSQPGSGKPGSSIAFAGVTTKTASAKTALPKVASTKIVPAKIVPAKTARKGNPQPKPSLIAARPATASASRTVQATARKPRVAKPRPIKTQPAVIGSQTAKKAIQAVTNAVTQVPQGTPDKTLRASRQADVGRTSKSAANTSSTSQKSTSQKSTSPKVDTSITNPIKLASNNERDAAAARAIANPQPVASIPTPKASGRIDNLSREEFGQRYFNRKLFEVWQRDGAKLRYSNWEEVPLELQILENNLFRSAIYLNGPGGNEAKDNEKPAQP
jgi:hypothetical protein